MYGATISRLCIEEKLKTIINYSLLTRHKERKVESEKLKVKSTTASRKRLYVVKCAVVVEEHSVVGRR